MGQAGCRAEVFQCDSFFEAALESTYERTGKGIYADFCRCGRLSCGAANGDRGSSSRRACHAALRYESCPALRLQRGKGYWRGGGCGGFCARQSLPGGGRRGYAGLRCGGDGSRKTGLCASSGRLAIHG